MTEHNTDDIVGHEETDADIGPLVRFAIFLTVVVLVSAALTAGFYKYLDAREQTEKATRSGEQQVSLAKRNVERIGERDQKVSARLRPAALDKAQMTRRHPRLMAPSIA